MAKNAILSQHTMSDDEERLLDDGVFPYLFGKIDGTTDVPPAQFDLAGNTKALKYKSAEIIGQVGTCRWPLYQVPTCEPHWIEAEVTTTLRGPEECRAMSAT